MDKTVSFNRSIGGARLMAAYVAQLEREGVAYQIHLVDGCTKWEVTITGA